MSITAFSLLLVEDDGGRRTSLVQAAERAGLKQVAVVSGAGARRYLERTSRSGRASPERFPSLVLFNLQDSWGLDVLSWLRAQPGIRRVVTVGLFDPRDGEMLGRAYDLGVNSCLARPDDDAGKVRLFQNLREYWERLNQTAEI